MEQPNSDPIPSERRDGYYILQLVKITPPRQQTLDEVKTKLTEQLKQERTSEKITARATEIRAKLDAELKAGKSFADAAQAVGLKAEKIPAFSQAEPPKGDQFAGREIASAALDLGEGQLSEVLTARGARVICRVDKRLPIDEAAFEKEKAAIAESFVQQHTEGAFQLWFAERVKAANIQTQLGS